MYDRKWSLPFYVHSFAFTETDKKKKRKEECQHDLRGSKVRWRLLFKNKIGTNYQGCGIDSPEQLSAFFLK
jgi:hypothetical protein